jgi:hypothetical protein
MLPAPVNVPRQRTIVISQSMYFPWCGLLEQIRMADVFVHYDDVQYVRGFFSRVQIKTSDGIKWLSVPLRNQHRGQTIDECRIDNSIDWKSKHLALLKQYYRKATYADVMLSVVESVFADKHESLGSLGRATIRALTRAFYLSEPKFYHSADLGVGGSSSQRLLDITMGFGGTVYLTGHGALNYLDHSVFENKRVQVRYMKYNFEPWSQLHGAFTPYVTSLDPLAHLGPDASTILQSNTIHWSTAVEQYKNFSINESTMSWSEAKAERS